MHEGLKKLKKLTRRNFPFCLIYKIILTGFKKNTHTHIKIKQVMNDCTLYTEKNQFLS